MHREISGFSLERGGKNLLLICMQPGFHLGISSWGRGRKATATARGRVDFTIIIIGNILGRGGGGGGEAGSVWGGEASPAPPSLLLR